MFGSDKRYLSISVNDTTIKVAQVKSSGAVERIARATATGTGVEDLAKALKSILPGFDQRAPVACVIPAGAATSKSIEVPSADQKEIKSIINLQASRHTPYSREEVLIGHINLGSTSVGTRVLLVIAHRNLVKDRLSMLEKCGLKTEKVSFAPEGIGRLYAKGLNLKGAASVGVIDVTSQALNFLIVGHGSTVFTRSIPFGLKELAEPDAGAVLAEELVQSMTAYQSENSEPVGSFVVTTEHPTVKGVLPALQAALKVDVRLSPYLTFVKTGQVKNKLQGDLADDSFLEVVAPGVTAAKAEVNLMPEEIIAKHGVERQSRQMIQAGIAAVIIMMLLVATFVSKGFFKESYLNKNLRDAYAKQKEEAMRLQDRMAKAKVIRDYLQGRMISLETISELNRITPSEIYLTTVTMDEDGALTLSGVSQSLSQVFTYVKSLDDSPMFKGAKTKSTATKKDGNKDVAVFEVTLRLDDGKPEVQLEAKSKE